MKGEQLLIQNAITKLEMHIKSSSLPPEVKELSLNQIHSIDISLLSDLSSRATPPLTRNNLSYILCFLAGLSTKVIAAIFNVEPATVHTSRYRLRARFVKTGILTF
jgi:hypothetical protein